MSIKLAKRRRKVNFRSS